MNSRNHIVLFGSKAVVAVAIWLLWLPHPILAHLTHATAPYTEHSVTPEQQAAAEQAWGIRILGVRLSAAGHMLDFRYRVLDPAKAGRLIHPKMGLLLLDQVSGATLQVPTIGKAGALRQTRSHLHPDRTYSVIFSNTAHLVSAGSRVTVTFGDLKLDNLVVE